MSYDPLRPPQDEMTAPWWAATRERRLLLQVCAACGTRQHPPRAVCTACGRLDALGWTEAAGAAVVDSATVVERAPMAPFTPPYVIARVRLAEGLLLLSTVDDVAPYDVAPGDAVRLAWRALPDGRALPVFRPATEEH